MIKSYQMRKLIVCAWNITAIGFAKIASNVNISMIYSQKPPRTLMLQLTDSLLEIGASKHSKLLNTRLRELHYAIEITRFALCK